MPEVVTTSHDVPSSSSLAMEFDADIKEVIPKQLNKTNASNKEFGDEFTFHPRVSSTSSRIVENSGLDFLARQQRHMDRQKKLYEDSQPPQQSSTSSQCDVTPKRQKMTGQGTLSAYASRPFTSEKSLLKRRSKMPKNHFRKDNEVLHKIDTDNMHRPIHPSTTPTLPPRAKTYYSSLSQSSTAGTLYTVGGRKKSLNDPYANFDRLQRAKMVAEKAIKYKKIFSIHGPYPIIRKALRERGWVEKEFKLPVKMKTNNKASGDSSDIDDDDDDDDDDDANKDSGIGMSPRPPVDSTENEENAPDDCYGIMGRLVRNEQPVFQWTTRTASIDWRFLQKDQIVNHFAKANFTTKVGLCMNLRMLSCFADGHSDTFFPRCYRLSNEEDKFDFIDDFRLTAASSILKVVISKHVDDNYGQDTEKIDNGQLPPPNGSHIIPTDVLLLAIKVCNMYGEERDHEDIDKDDSILKIPPSSWDQLIFHYGKLVHEGAVVLQSGSYFKQCEQALAHFKEKNPQLFIEGVKNTWIIKPGAKSRGRGILVMNNLNEILKLVAGDSTLIKDSRWVVQKYIERPLLIHATKFDVRQWFLVTDWNPVTVWIYKESYLRFSSRPFSLKNLEPCIHLCNYSVQKNFEVDANRHPLLPADNMWSDTDFRNYLRTRGCHTLWDDRIFPGMKKSIIHICQTAQDIVEYRKGSFELYGADFMIDENYNPWLIEVNSSPTMSRSTAITSKLCASVQEDTLKVILDRKKDRNCDVGQFELIFKQPAVDVPLYVGKALQVEGVTIKKPSSNLLRRSVTWNNQSHASCSNNGINGNNQNGDSQSTASKASNKPTVYSQTASCFNRPTKVTLQNSSNIQNKHSPVGSKTSRSSRLLNERTNSPVRIKMQNTLKRLTSEATNTPAKPNAFNLPKCPSGNVSVGSSGSTTSLPPSSVPSQVSLCKNSSQSRKNNSNQTPVKLLSHLEQQVQSSSNTTVHFVSSSQAKAASSMGIMHVGTAYNSMIAAANRGCLPCKVQQSPYAIPQAIVPKTFPVSGIPGGDVVAGGHVLSHPSAPAGVIAVTPQNVGLGLPFQRYFNMNADAANMVATGSQPSFNRRSVAYGNQDFRLGAPHPRVSDSTNEDCVICGSAEKSLTPASAESNLDVESATTTSRETNYPYRSSRNRRHFFCHCAANRSLGSNDFLTNRVRCIGDPLSIAVRNEN
ncbi:uncharacterized protein LOC143448955 isoform X1 [Clavelina lepadiformis]|uniref:uncharacterized protein LOC143448955 isoform X1 n=1 Tax=Clavelina lepadiformis TaxID=159417 RepID=UPI004043202A